MRLLASLAPTKNLLVLVETSIFAHKQTNVRKVRERALRKFERIFVMQNLLNVMYVGYATVGFELLRKSKCVPQIYERRAVTHDHCTGTNVLQRLLVMQTQSCRPLMAYRNGLLVRRTGSSAGHQVLAIRSLGSRQTWARTWIEIGEREGGGFLVCFSPVGY